MYEIMYYLDYEGWVCYTGDTPTSLEECEELAKKLSKLHKFQCMVIEIKSLFTNGKKQ